MTIVQTWSKSRAATAAVLAAAAVVGAVHAQNPARDRSGLGSSASYEEYLQGSPARVSELLGMRVRGTTDSTIGEVQDAILAEAPDDDLALIVSVEGLREIGDKLIARPLEDFRIAADGSELYLDITDQQLSAEPSYTVDNADEQAASAAGPSAGAVVPGEPIAALLGAAVTDENGREIGKIDDLLVPLGEEGETRAVLAIGGIAGFGAKLVAVPFASVEITRSAESGPVARPEVRLGMQADAVERLPPFEYSDREQRAAAL